MMKHLLMALLLLPLAVQAQTLEECQRAAEQNYPLIRQYDLIGKTTELTVAGIQKGWLPQVSAQAQATLQSDVTAWPDEMRAMMNQMGIDLKGLRKDQYGVALDVNQTVYDGGAKTLQKEAARRQGAVQTAQNEVRMYEVRQRVMEMYFALLLIDEQLRLNGELQRLLKSNEQKLAAMLKRGTAAESDHNNVKAERLNVAQQGTNLEALRKSAALMLSIFCGIDVNNPVKPDVPSESTTTQAAERPELRVIDAQLRLTDTQEKALNAGLRPKLSVFAQGFYGYPGYNLFEDMMHHRWSLNGMIGARIAWNIGALYTRKNDKAKLNVQRDMYNVQRDVFLLNHRLEQQQEREDVERYRKLMATDAEIISLRSAVRKAAESKLEHGIIDVNDLVKELNNENTARVQQSIHEIEMLRELYRVKD